MEKTNDKKEYRRAIAVLQKADGETYDHIAREHIRTTKKWISDYIRNGIEGLKIRKNYDGRKPRITDEDREVVLSCYSTIHISLLSYKYMESTITCTMSYRWAWHSNQLQTPAENN